MRYRCADKITLVGSVSGVDPPLDSLPAIRLCIFSYRQSTAGITVTAPISEKMTVITERSPKLEMSGKSESISAENPLAVTSPETVTEVPIFLTALMIAAEPMSPPFTSSMYRSMMRIVYCAAMPIVIDPRQALIGL